MQREAGPFDILEVLGEGSFGTVCVARVSADPLGRKVALKILKGAYAKNRKILNRTRDEARLLAKISHPNIVRVEQLMTVHGRPVVVMEHVEGVSLDQLLLRFKDGLPGAVALELVRQTCLALHVAYQEALGDDGRPLRVIHRDIKPSNILLSIHGEVKVVDFGIAKGEFEGREAKTESVVMGSRPYMAPERLDGVMDSPAVDVYSSGMSLFELLAGRTMALSINPVNHEKAMNRQLQYVAVQGMPRPAVEDLHGLMRRMCAYNRDYRPTAIECVRDLEQLVTAIEPRYRIGLDEFARTTVLPIYESRPRILPTDAVESHEDEQFLREVTDALTSPEPLIREHRPRFPLAPILFVAGLAMAVALVSTLALAKFVVQEVVPSFSQGDVARVKVWIPSDAQARVGDVQLNSAGTMVVPEGPTLLQIVFEDGRAVECAFEARDGAAVRYVGNDGLSIDDGDARPCRPVEDGG